MILTAYWKLFRFGCNRHNRRYCPNYGENRTFVKLGLSHISRTDRIGLRALLEHASMDGVPLTSSNVAFTIVPRINATGRIGSPDRAVHLLISEDPDEAQELAADICDNNEFRRQIETEILENALELIKKEPQRMYDRVMVVEGEGWHHGVIGIVASRLTDTFGKPCIVISFQNGEARGSGEGALRDFLFLTRYVLVLNILPNSWRSSHGSGAKYESGKYSGFPQSNQRLCGCFTGRNAGSNFEFRL